ncbi:fimbrillin family protein [Culturomica massiliensis]|uniref:fimbrillin family protein n=1 Tax=Culturomica massiliensis TaxID=1841857 RepID=UPI002664FC62|nr:fimbrillin family protein [Culturomica massiliensis]
MSISRKKYLMALSCLFWYVLLSVSCDTPDGPDLPSPGDAVPLRFSASASLPGETPGTRAVGELIEGFPKDGTTSTFGMSLTKEDGTTPLFTGSGHVRMDLRKTGGAWQSSLHTPDGSEELTGRAMVLPGARVRVQSWYPLAGWTRRDDGTIAFDFSADMEENPQKELLVVAPGDQLKTVGADGKVALSFSHAWTHIVINVKKAAGAAVTIRGAGVDNQGGFWIRNRGRIDPSTGLRVAEADADANAATAGEIGGNRNETLSLTDNKTYHFFVPSFMSRDVQSESVALFLKTGADGSGSRLVFPLGRAHLNSEGTGDTTRYGFRQGYRNTYNLVYDNTAMSLSLTDWTSLRMDYSFELPEIQTAGVTHKAEGWTVDGKSFTHDTLPDNQKYMYNDWLGTVALKNNGSYVTVAPDDTRPSRMENVASMLWVSKRDAVSLPVEWSVVDGSLVAREFCRVYGDGKWRLPRASEFRMMLLEAKDNPRQLLGLSPDRPYWTGTESNADKAWMISYAVVSGTDNALRSWRFESTFKTQKAYVRCVRDRAP